MRRYNILLLDKCVKEGSSDDFKNWLDLLNLSRHETEYGCVGVCWSVLE